MRILIAFFIVILMVLPVNGMEFTPPNVPDVAEEYLPKESNNFWVDILSVIGAAAKEIAPSAREAMQVCLSFISVSIMVGVLEKIRGGSADVINLIYAVISGVIMMRSANSMIELGAKTITEISEYGKMILPVLTGALAAQGGVTTSAALYAGTTLFGAVLMGLIQNVLIPALYIYLCISIAFSAVSQGMLKQARDFLKWFLTWSLKIILYVYMGYMSITGVISGTVDASAVKAAKLTLSGAVPVVGGIISDASETILVGAGVMKNAAGTYGLVVLAAILISPFLKIAIQYITLKVCGGICGIFMEKQNQLIIDFSSAMGFLLAMTGVCCLLFMISIVCFIKGVSL